MNTQFALQWLARFAANPPTEKECKAGGLLVSKHLPWCQAALHECATEHSLVDIKKKDVQDHLNLCSLLRIRPGVGQNRGQPSPPFGIEARGHAWTFHESEVCKCACFYSSQDTWWEHGEVEANDYDGL